MTARDVDHLARRIDHLTRAAGRIRTQLADLHVLAFEAAVHDTEQSRSTGFESRPPPGADRDIPDLGTKPPRRIGRRDQAHHLWARAETELARVEKILVGLERAVTGWFMVTSAVEATRGSLIHADDHEQQLVNQRRRANNGEYTPAPLVDQPRHPGAGR